MATVMTFTDPRFDNMHKCGRSVGGGREGAGLRFSITHICDDQQLPVHFSIQLNKMAV